MLDLVPVTFREANAFVEQHHRHHGKVVGHKFSIAAADTETGEIVGVAIVGRPVSRHLDDGWTLEVNRLCTNGRKNACSMLYAAAWRAAPALPIHFHPAAFRLVPSSLSRTYVTSFLYPIARAALQAAA